MSKIIGIDLGTTNSALAAVVGGEPKILENAEGARTTPSVVAQSKNGERLVGQLARRQAVTNPENTIYGVKRFMGHRFSDEGVQKDLKAVSYHIEEGDKGNVLIKMGDKTNRPEEVSAMILQKLKADAESRLGEKVEKAVITVPAYFNDEQRQATIAAGEIAGLKVERIINEPTAAALAYGFDKKTEEKIVVFDFGGGTFDVSILEVGDDVVEVRGTHGDSHLGGKDIDQQLIDFLATEFQKESGVDIRGDKLALQRLDEASEKAKIELSTASETEVNIPFITSTDAGPKHLLVKITRAKLEELAKPFIDRSIEITKKAFADAGMEMSEVGEVIMVGGQTRMPRIQEAVKELFGKEPNTTINPDEVVAMGAAIQGGVIGGDVQDITLIDVLPLSLGIETMGGIATKLIEKNTAIPTQASQTFTTAADNQPSVDVHIVQGEREMAGDNKSLGRFILDGIAPAQRGVPQIEVSFDIDRNGVLNVTAKEKSTGKEQSIRIEATSGITDEEVEKMKKDAEAHADEDKKKKEIVEARNMADQLIHTAESSVKEHKDKLPEELQKSIEEKVKALNEVKSGDDLEAIKTKTEELSTEAQKIGQHITPQQDAGQAEAEQTTSEGEQEATDVDFEEKKDDDSQKEG